MNFKKRKKERRYIELWNCGCLTYLVVELRKLHLNFIPLEIVILCLLTHRWYQVELACNWVCLLVPNRQKKNAMVTKRKTVLNLREKSERFWMDDQHSPWFPWHSSVRFPSTWPYPGLLQMSWPVQSLQDTALHNIIFKLHYFDHLRAFVCSFFMHT